MIDRGSWIILGVTSALRLVVGLQLPSLTGAAERAPFGAHALAALCGLAAGIALVRAASSLDGDAAGRRLAWMWAVLPLFWSAFSTGSPFAPLYACVGWALFALVRALRTGAGFWWMVCGTLSGLATLSDWSALLLPLGLVVAAAGSRATRSQLAGRVQVAALATSLAIAVVVLSCRARWGADVVAADALLAPSRNAGSSVVERGTAFFLSEALIAGPVLALMLAVVALRVFRNGATPARAVLTHWIVVVIVIGGLAGLATGAMVSRTPVVWLAGTVVLGTSALVVEQRSWWRAGLAVALALAFFLSAGLLHPSPPSAVSLARPAL